MIARTYSRPQQRPPALPGAALATALAALLLASPAQARRAPDFPGPPKADVTMIAENMNINGRSTQVRTFFTELDMDEVTDFYDELWSEPVADGGPGMAREDRAMAPWRVLTRVEDGYAMTVQVQPTQDEGSWGYLARSRLPRGGVTERLPEPPSLRGSQVLSNVEHDDAGKTAQTTMLVNKHSATTNADFYRRQYAGWRVDMDRSFADGKFHTMSYARGREQVMITVEGNAGQARVVINKVKRDLL